jgi:hypothetical protein
MVLDPDDSLFIENEGCIQFASVPERGGQDTNWHLIAARRGDKLRPPRSRVEHGGGGPMTPHEAMACGTVPSLDRIMQALDRAA